MSTSSATLSVPNSAVYGFIPQSLCLTVALPGEPSALFGRELEADRMAFSRQLELPLDPPALDGGRPKLDRGPHEDLFVDRLLYAGLVVLAEGLDAAAPPAHAASGSQPSA